MTLLEIRQKFIALSGRLDLATTTDRSYDTDAGADYFIGAAVRWLDRQRDVPQQDAVWKASLAIDEYYVDIEGARAIKSVWMVDSDGAREKLHKSTYEEIQQDYPELGAEDSGTPEDWCRQIVRSAPGQWGDGGKEETTRVLIMPPTEEAIDIEVQGVFASRSLTQNDDVCWWSVNFPETLVSASLMILEQSYRNAQGAEDYRRAAMDGVEAVDHDEVEEGLVDEQMEMEG